jgi:deoxyribonuclease V
VKATTGSNSRANLGLETSWPRDAAALDSEQRRLAALTPDSWDRSEAVVRVGGVFLAFARGQAGPGRAGDRGWVAAAVLELPGERVCASIVRPTVAGAGYDPGRLALREGPALAGAVARLPLQPDVILVDATGRDHPRGAGLALHLGAVLAVPTVGVTHRPLLARGEWPPDRAAASTPLTLDNTVVGAWLRTRKGVRPLAIHAAWRTDATTAVQLVQRCVMGVRTPEPLRVARRLARLGSDSSVRTGETA